ncbi:hypothetical protein MAPG_01531 [Magnaporthiopsis poae ATCC 64411]|uniref:Alpha/beta hydrolase fold-3 domain-containing protein n=1 Tax=Magnaporthiopsis poae (strain ATCC 64411 / 73-15) TaxID=644358 RepID=A0A0C4DNY2_MAGP6|nr:hypothetical protein MAPG_01531 [Magnaporthiopsis poae ATCC 64411]
MRRILAPPLRTWPSGSARQGRLRGRGLAAGALAGGRVRVNPARIVVGGISAGGGVAANAALLGRDRGLNRPLAAQLLRHPTLDDCTSLAPDDRMRPYLIWTAENSELAWLPYLAGSGRCATAARAEDVSGLPPTFIGVGSLDLFRDEGVAYAARLARTGVAVEFHLYLEVPHGFKGAALGIRQAREM